MLQWLNNFDFFFLITITILILNLFNFVYEKELVTKVHSSFDYTSNLFKRNIFKNSVLTNRLFYQSLNILTVYLILNLIILGSYQINWTFYYALEQFYITNISIYFVTTLLYLFLITLILLANLFKNQTSIMNNRIFILSVFNSFIFLLCLNNYFAVVILLEIQGILILYFISSLSTISTTITINKIFNDKFFRLKQKKMCTLTALFIQFWVSFIAVIFFIFLGLRLIYIFGAINWVDIHYLTYLAIFTFPVKKQIVLTLGVIFIIGLYLKLGLFPFYFWKPDIYKNLHVWGMFWFMTNYTLAVTFLTVFILVVFFEYLTFEWRVLIYVIQLTTLLILPNVLFSITEIKPFLAYMSIFNSIYLLTMVLTFRALSLQYILNYLFVYVFLTTLFFLFFFIVKNNIRFLTDIQFIRQNSFIVGLFSTVFASMAGFPPFAGFWIKISVVMEILAASEVILAAIILANGMFLLYFYFYNYKFNVTLKFNWNKQYIYFTQASNIFYIFIGLFSIINFFNFFFLNDMINFSYLLALVQLV